MNDASRPRAGNKDGTAALLPVDIPGSDVKLARGIKAGNWVFATGQAGTDYDTGLSPEVLRSDHPLNGEPKAKREARRIYANLADVLSAGDSSKEKVVRIDQYYSNPSVIDAYHEVRREAFAGPIPPSTSNLHQRFARRGQAIEVQAIAVDLSGPDVVHEDFKPSYDIHHSSGYSPGLRAGDFRFIPGQTAEARDEKEPGLDPLAQPSRGLWKGTPIKLETDFVIRRKMIPSLESAGAGLDSVVKAQIYLRDQDDIPAFNEVWHSHFKNPPATTIIPTCNPGFIIPEARIEINVVALAKGGRTEKVAVSGGIRPLFDGWVSAVRAGDLLFLSGLMAQEISRSEIVESYYEPTQLRVEMTSIIKQARDICHAAGTSLGNVVRIQQFHKDIGELPSAVAYWSDELDGAPLPISAIEVPWLPIPDARVLVDLWIYAPL